MKRIILLLTIILFSINVGYSQGPGTSGPGPQQVSVQFVTSIPTICALNRLIIVKSTGAQYMDILGACTKVGSGTGGVIPSLVQGDILYASAANTLSALAKNTSATRYLSNTGTSNNPAWAQVDLTNGVTGALAVANGGTGTGSTLAGLVRGSGTAMTAAELSGDATTSGSNVLTLASTITAGGPTGSATVAPIITYDAKGRLTTVSSATITPAVGSITGLGTGVATALGTNIGSAGAPVTNGGALGTPSSGVATNLTGTASININGTVGATTPASVTATTLTASSTSSLVGNVTVSSGATTSAQTDLLINPTTKASGTLFDLQVNSTSKFNVNFSGVSRQANVSAVPNLYVYLDGTSAIADTSANRNIVLDGTNGIHLKTGWHFGWTSGDAAGSARTRFSENAAGVVQIGTTSDNAAGSLMAVNATLTGTMSTSSTTDSTTTTTGALQVAGGAAIRKRVFIDGITSSSGLQTAVLCQSSGGEMIADTVACLASSARFKNRIKPLNVGLNEILNLHPVSFFYKPEGIFTSNPNFKHERVGLIAEDVAKIDRRLVGFEKDGVTPRTVGYEQIVPVLIKAVQEQQKEIEELKRQVAELKRPLVRHRPRRTR
jgi:hypothetical protein